MHVQLSLIEVLLLVVGGAASACHLWLSIIGFHLERYYKPTQRMFTLTTGLLSYSVLMMTLCTSPLVVELPVLLIGPTIASGFIASSFMIYISGVVRPLKPASRRWLLLGVPGVLYAIAVCSIDGGLNQLLQFVHFSSREHHPILSPMFLVHTLTILVSLGGALFYIVTGLRQTNEEKLRAELYWLLYGTIVSVGLLASGNIAPLIGFPRVVALQPLLTLPIALLCYRALRQKTDPVRLAMGTVKAETTRRQESLGRLARGVSHDINNMLTSIMGSAELIRMGKNIDAEVETHVNQIVNTSVRAGQLMDGMLIYSRQGIAPKAVRPKALIMEAVLAARAQAPDCVTLSSEISNDLPWIRVAPQDLVSAILNLLLNAFEALGDSEGTVTLTAHSLESAVIPQRAFGAKIDGHPSMLIAIQDDGCGMDETTMSHIYEPFFSTKRDGRGLGLMSVFSTIQRSGGAIHCSSTIGTGTQFRLWVPIAEAPDNDEASTADDLNGGQIIMVEDNHDVRMVLKQMLEALSTHVIEFSSSEDACAWFNSEAFTQPCLYLIDIRLPGESGVSLAHRLLDSDVASPILLMSGDEHEKTMEQFADHPHVHFIRKPLNLSKLRQALQALGLEDKN